jgi:hypothetical protein
MLDFINYVFPLSIHRSTVHCTSLTHFMLQVAKYAVLFFFGVLLACCFLSIIMFGVINKFDNCCSFCIFENLLVIYLFENVQCVFH